MLFSLSRVPAHEAIKTHYLKIAPCKVDICVLTWILQKQMATFLVIKIILLTLKTFIGKYTHLNCIMLSSYHSCGWDRERSVGFYGVFSRKVQTNPCICHHLQDIPQILRVHNRTKIDSPVGIVLCENLLLLFMKHIKVNVKQVKSKLTLWTYFLAFPVWADCHLSHTFAQW